MQLELDMIAHFLVTSLTINFCLWKSLDRVPWPDVILNVASVNKLSIHFCLLFAPRVKIDYGTRDSGLDLYVILDIKPRHFLASLSPSDAWQADRSVLLLSIV